MNSYISVRSFLLHNINVKQVIANHMGTVGAPLVADLFYTQNKIQCYFFLLNIKTTLLQPI